MSRQIVTKNDVLRAQGKYFDWPLAVSTFTLRDKLSIAKWLLTNDRYTMGEKVQELEDKFTQLSGMLSLCVSSGSAANQLVFELWKIKNPGQNAVVIAPAVTWISSVSPAIMAGFDVKFCDVNLTDFSFDYDKLEEILKKYRRRRIIIWPTALIGFCPDMERLNNLAKRYHAELYMDSCENTLSTTVVTGKGRCSILASCDITTTSLYFSHQIVMCEGGFVFFKSREDYELAKMFRNHGLIRSLGPHNAEALHYANMDKTIDPQFLFALNGTNLRPTDVHAMFGLRDFARAQKSLAHRNRMYMLFHDKLASINRLEIALQHQPKYSLPELTYSQSGFCLPIFTNGNNLGLIKQQLRENDIEVRPIIGSNLLRQPALKEYGNPLDFPNAEWIHHHGCYVGLHKNVTEKMINRLIEILGNVPR